MVTEEDIVKGVIKALKSEEAQNILAEAMARKLENVAGWNCHDPKERAEIRKDMEMARTLRLRMNMGVERALLWLFGVGAIAVLSWLGGKGDLIK